MENNKNCHIKETNIGGTVYIVESMVSYNATETTYTKMQRLILSNLKEELKLSDTLQLSSKTNSTSAI